MFFPDGNTLILNEQEQKQCEGFLTASECLESLKSMESNKSPGSDGLPAEFYKVFWNDINQHLLNALNCAYTKGLLSITQRRGLITLIPKKNKPTNLLKNWRPITLLNCDYKIATIRSFIQYTVSSMITKFSGMGRFTYPWCPADTELHYKLYL